MLTPVQKKIRRELEELHVNGMIQQQAHLSESVQAVPKKTSRFIKMILFVLVCTIVSIVIYIQYTRYNHNEFILYLSKVQLIHLESETMLKNLPASNPETITAAADLLTETENVAAPLGFREHKQDLIHEMEQLLVVIRYLTDGSPDSVQLNKYLIDLRIKQGLQRESLLQAFQSTSIKYLQGDDGTITYWIKDQVYQYK